MLPKALLALPYSRVNLAEGVCSSDELNRWSLVWVGREKDRAKRIPKSFNAACEIQTLQDVKLPFIHTHVVMIIKIYKTSVEGAVIGG